VSPPAKFSNFPLIAGTLGVGFGLTLLSQAWLQIVNSDHVIEQAKTVNKGARTTKLVGVRGSIYDRNGQPLSVNGSLVDVSLTRGRVPETDAFWLAVSNVTGIPSSELSQRVLALPLPKEEEKPKSVSWPVHFTQSQWDDFAELVRSPRPFHDCDYWSSDPYGSRICWSVSGVPVLAGASAYAVAESFGWRLGLERKVREAPGFYAIIAAGMLAGLAFQYLPISPMKALFWSAVINGLAAAPLVVAIVVLSSRRSVMGPFVAGPWLLLRGWITVAVMVAAAVCMFWSS
jgi:hypothetical protein